MNVKIKDTAITLTSYPAIGTTDWTTPANVAYNAAGIAVTLYQETADGLTATAITPSNTNDSSHNYWTGSAVGTCTLRVTAAQNASYCRMWFVASATGVATFVSPRYLITTANVANSLNDGTDVLDVSIIQWLGVAPAALSSQQVQAVVPDTQKVDVNTIGTKGVTVNSGGTTFPASVGTSTLAAGAKMDLADTLNQTGVTDLKSKLGTIPASGNWNTTTPPTKEENATAVRDQLVTDGIIEVIP